MQIENILIVKLDHATILFRQTLHNYPFIVEGSKTSDYKNADCKLFLGIVVD